MTGASEIEWVDSANGPSSQPPDTIHPHGPRPGWPRWRWWYALVALAVLAGIVVATRPRDGADSAGSPASVTTTPLPTPSVVTPTTSRPVPVSDGTGPPTVTTVGPLLDVPTSWELFGRASSAVIRIQLAAGRISVTPIPLLSSSGPASFIVGSDRAIVRPLDSVPGYQIRDDQPAEALSNKFPNSGPAIPGPGPNQIWVPGNTDLSMTLIGLDASSTGVDIGIPAPFDSAALSSDGSGYMLFGATGGVYDLRPTGISRITTGQVVAIGPTGWLTDDCDNQFRCTLTVVNRADGSRRALSTPASVVVSGGVLSPDGTRAAVLEGTQASPAQLHLIDLRTGADRTTAVALDPNQNYQTGLFVWSPDSRWLFATNATGRLYGVDTSTGDTTTLDVAALGPVSQLALRAPTS